jgi:hypothetical protein
MLSKDELKEIADKHGIEPEQVHFINSNFWRGVRYFLSHPLESKKGILIKGLFNFELNPKKIKRYLDEKSDRLTEEEILFYKQLYKQVTNEHYQ